MVGSEHDPDARQDDVELAVGERERFGIRLPPIHLYAVPSGHASPRVEELWSQVGGHHARSHGRGAADPGPSMAKCTPVGPLRVGRRGDSRRDCPRIKGKEGRERRLVQVLYWLMCADVESGYHQFCPVAKAMELLDERWTLLIVRELASGSQQFNELRRGLPRISPSLLSKRLQ